MEVLDEGFANTVSERIGLALENATPVKLEELRARPFLVRLTERILWLASPYL